MLIRSKLDRWCDAVLEAGWLAAVVVAPLFFNVFSSRVFEPDKISLVRTIALTMAVAWLIKLANGGYSWLPAFAPASEAGEVQGSNWRGFLRNPFFIPVALLVIAYLVSTSFSVAGFVSWFGSYQRLQGTYSFLAYVLIGGLTAATLRRPEQIRRLQHAVIVTSLACSIYGVVQHYRLDPLPWGGDVTTRVAGNAGNAIFLSAYLIMGFFLTLERVFSSFVRLLGIGQPASADLQDWQTSLAGGAYLFVLMVEAVAIVWTQSRGPWLGWALGIYLFVLLTLGAVRPHHFRALTIAWVSIGFGLAIFLIVANTVPALSGLRSLPYMGRLMSMLDLNEGTNRVRTLIWEGAAELTVPHEPLVFPDGRQDGTNLLRPLVGYGPEAMWIAYNRFYPPDLAHIEARNASPDRSHNETWDSLVITGLFGFLTYTAVFLSIFYWALRWLGLVTNRRDKILFATILAGATAVVTAAFLAFDGWQWRLFGVAVPFGLISGYAIYMTVAAFLHANTRPDRADLPRQILIISLLAAIVAHYLEIHFAIAIGATRTHFWVMAATLMVVGMRFAQPIPVEIAETEAYGDLQPSSRPAPTAANPVAKTGKRGSKATTPTPTPRRVRRPTSLAPLLPAAMMTDLLVFLTFVYIYTTNVTNFSAPFAALFSSVLQRPLDGQMVSSPAIFFLLLFTWLVAATICLAAESLSHRRAPSQMWWLRGYGLHAAIVWGGWLLYGLIQGFRLAPMAPPPGVSNEEFLNLQLERVAGHFGFYTFVLVLWLLGAGTVYAWPWLRGRSIPVVRRPLATAAVATAGVILATFLVFTVNINLVKADIVYKQGQQFDSQGNWVSSIELYKRALATRKTEDQYMLFLGRALLEQAKLSQSPAAAILPAEPNLDDVLALQSDQVAQMSRDELLAAAEVVLLEAQRVNPLNTDHTANLARLYRTWAELLTADPAVRETMLDKSIAMYDKAVTLSPNAAHLWNERGNAFAAVGADEDALASFEKSLSIDQLFDQTYVQLADLLDRTGQTEQLNELLDLGIATFTAANNPNAVAQMLSYLSVIQARNGDLDAAAATNKRMLELMPGNVAALRNLAVIARDQNKPDEALDRLNQAIAAAGQNPGELKPLYLFAAELYQARGDTAQVIANYERARQMDPNDAGVIFTLLNLYTAQQDDAKIAELGQTLMAVEPQNFQYPLVVAEALARLNRPQEALPFAQQALTLAPEEQKAGIQELVQQLGGAN